MADFTLVVRADVDASLSNFKRDISEIVGKLNSSPPKIKIEIDKKNTEEQINNVRNQLKDLGKEASRVKFGTELSASLSGINKNISALSKSIADIGKNTGLSNIADGFKQLTPVIENLKGELKSLQSAISSFQGVNINLGLANKNPVAQNAAYGQAARAAIADMKASVTATEEYIAKYYQLADKAQAMQKIVSQTGMQNQFQSIGSKLGRGSLQEQIESLKEYLLLLDKMAKMQNIPVGDKITSYTAKVTEGVKKVQTGEQQLEASTEKLKSIFGSGVNAEALTTQLNNIYLEIQNVSKAINDLGAGSKPFEGFRESIATIVTALNDLHTVITEIRTTLSTTDRVEVVNSGESATVNELKTSIAELRQTVVDYIAAREAEREADREAAAAKEEALKKAREAAAAKREQAKAEKEAAKEKAAAEKEAAQEAKAAAQQEEAARKASEAEDRRRERIVNSYRNAVSLLTGALGRLTAAEHSANESSRDAYKAMGDAGDAMKQAHSSLDGTKESYDRLDAAVKKCRGTIKDSEATIRANGDATKSLSDRMGGLATKFASWLTVSQVIMYAYRAVRKMVSASIELESAMAQLQVVTKASNEEMKKFGTEAAQVAQRTATSITDVVSSSTTYARLGYSMDESKQLAEYTAMLQKVGDIDVSDAQDAVTAIIKAYGKGADEIEDVMNKLVEVGNNYPISVSQLAEGMNNASSTLSAAGNSFEQSVALLTAANTVVQNAAKSSTGLRTIAARIRKTKTELDDLGEAMTDSDYDALVKGLTDAGVSITNTNGELRSTYEIMQDIAKVWDNLSSMQQAGLAETLSGTRQQAIFYSIVEQFKEASGAMGSMANSNGALDNAYDVVLQTTESKIEQLKAKFQELGSDLMSSDMLGGFVDAAHTVLDLLDGITKTLGGVPALIGVIAASLSAVKNIGRVRMFTLKKNMPIVAIVLFGYEQFRCCG